MSLRGMTAILALATAIGSANGTRASDDPPAAKVETPKNAVKTAGSTEKTSKKKTGKPKMEVATFGGGCFWSMEAIFERIGGVKSVVSGFSGGNVANPSYEQVCTGGTGHAEVVNVVYDPEAVSFEKLLKVFWAAHDPTTLNSQGDDFGTQYRSAVFFHNEEQRKETLKSFEDLTKRKVFREPVVTELVPFAAFFPADGYHQDYYRHNRDSEYSQIYIVPKLRKLKLK